MPGGRLSASSSSTGAHSSSSERSSAHCETIRYRALPAPSQRFSASTVVNTNARSERCGKSATTGGTHNRTAEQARKSALSQGPGLERAGLGHRHRLLRPHGVVDIERDLLLRFARALAYLDLLTPMAFHLESPPTEQLSSAGSCIKIAEKKNTRLRIRGRPLSDLDSTTAHATQTHSILDNT